MMPHFSNQVDENVPRRGWIESQSWKVGFGIGKKCSLKLTGESESDWNKTDTPRASSSDPRFLC